MTGKQTGRSRAAFTLVEVMISMVILSLVVAAIYASWIAIVKGARSAQVATADVQRMRIAVQTLDEAFVGARMYVGNPDLYSFEDKIEHDYTAISFATKLPPSFPRSGRHPGQDLRRVTFTVESGNGRENELVLRQSPVLLEPDEDEEKFPLVLARDVTAFNIEFWDTNDFEWMDEWDLTNELPTMVRITLGVGTSEHNRNRPRELVRRVVAVPGSAVPPAIGPGRGAPPGAPVAPPVGGQPGGPPGNVPSPGVIPRGP